MKEVTIPCRIFDRSNSHYSKIYYGASILAFNSLLNTRGYKLVASNKSGNNIFFVHNDHMGKFSEISVKDAYRKINFRESHNKSNNLTFNDFEDAKKTIDDLDVYDIKEKKLIKIKSL